MTAIAVTPTAISSTLWDKAFNSLDVNTKAGLSATKTHKRDILVSKELYNPLAYAKPALDIEWVYSVFH